MRALVTNAEAKHSLPVIRSLGEKGVEVVAASHHRRALGFYSRYCRDHLITPRAREGESYIRCLLRELEDREIDVLIPVGGEVTESICYRKSRFTKYTRLALPPDESMAIASNKNRTIELASNLGISTPATYFPRSIEEVEKNAVGFRYPAVLKAAKGRGSVRYASSATELVETYRELCRGNQGQISNGFLPQVQEYVPGGIRGYFALMNRGETVASFQHQRIHQLPPSGGPSTMAMSIHDLELRELGSKVLSELGWHGVAMVEFKRDSRDGQLKLLEINPKFWGSLDLAVAAGVDFPYLLFRMCTGDEIPSAPSYRDGVVFKWLVPDLLHSVQSGCLSGYLSDLLNRSIQTDLRTDDLRPSLIQLYRMFGGWKPSG